MLAGWAKDSSLAAALGRLFGARLGRVAQAEEIGSAIAALASDGSAWITAQRIEASGGFRL
jgi:NAD(P)-dependent dehydrogenase (short-subunit alcohol dehydrogenase family)